MLDIDNRFENEKESGYQHYLVKFNSLFSTPKLSSTYKLFFIKSLLDLAEYNDQDKNAGLLHNSFNQSFSLLYN